MTEIKKLVCDKLTDKDLFNDITITEENFFLVDGIKSNLRWSVDIEEDLERNFNPKVFEELVQLCYDCLVLEKKYKLENKIYK